MNKDLSIVVGMLAILCITALGIAAINVTTTNDIDKRKSEDYRKCLETIQAPQPDSRILAPTCYR